MTDANQPPTIPWWVSYWTDPTTTRSSLRQQAWLFFFLAAVAVCISVVFGPWRPEWFSGEIVLPVAAGLFPVAFTVGGVWVLAAVRWIDRHQAWDRLATKQEREAAQAVQSLWLRSLPSGFLLMAIGAAVGALAGWFWAIEGGLFGGLMLGVLGGFVVGITLAGFREGIRSNAGKSADGKPQDAEPRGTGDGDRSAG